MEKNLGFNNGDRKIDEVAFTIENLNVGENTNPYQYNANYFGSCSNISYKDSNDDVFDVF